MLASVLNTTTAVHASIQVVRAFIKLRLLLATNVELTRKLAKLENSLTQGRTLRLVLTFFNGKLTRPFDTRPLILLAGGFEYG